MDKAEAIERLEYLKVKAQIALEKEVPEWIAEDVLGTIEAYDMAIEALQTENSSEKPNNCEPKICDTCRYYNSNIPCGSTPSACKEADKFAEEFVDGLKKLKPKVEPKKPSDDDETIQAIAHLQKVGWLQEHDRALTEQTEPQTRTDEDGRVWEYRNGNWWQLGKTEPQTDCAWE